MQATAPRVDHQAWRRHDVIAQRPSRSPVRQRARWTSGARKIKSADVDEINVKHCVDEVGARSSRSVLELDVRSTYRTTN